MKRILLYMNLYFTFLLLSLSESFAFCLCICVCVYVLCRSQFIGSQSKRNEIRSTFVSLTQISTIYIVYVVFLLSLSLSQPLEVVVVVMLTRWDSLMIHSDTHQSQEKEKHSKILPDSQGSMRESSSSEVFPHSMPFNLPFPPPPPLPEWYSLISKSFLYTGILTHNAHTHTHLLDALISAHLYTLVQSICLYPFHKKNFICQLYALIYHMYWVNRSELIEHWPIPNLNLFMWTKSFRNRNFSKRKNSSNTSPCLNILMVISLLNGV